MTLLKISLRTYAFGFFMLCALLVYFSVKRTVHSPYLPNTVTIVDQCLKGIQASRYDKAGNLIQVLNVKSWQHLQGDPSSELIAPQLKIYQGDGIWHISAEKGQSVQTQISSKIDTLHLSNNVVVTFMEDYNSAWELKTTHLVVHPQQSLITTKAPVVITTQGIAINAKGMKANLKDHTLNLLNDVKSYYVAHQN